MTGGRIPSEVRTVQGLEEYAATTGEDFWALLITVAEPPC